MLKKFIKNSNMLIWNRGCTYSTGYMVSFNDIGGSLSGIIYGMANTLSSIAAITAPLIQNLLTPNVNKRF